MSTLTYILLFTFIGSVVSLIGGILLLANKKFALGISHYLSSFAAGALLGTVFFDLLPEAGKEAGDIDIYLWALIGILAFFLLERFIHWFHHSDEKIEKKSKQSVVALVTVGDSVHNFIDGVAIAASFLISTPLGIITALAVAAHEIPQEIGDFGILLHKGLSRARVLWLNVLSSLTAMLGAILTFALGDKIHNILPIFPAITAGFFIYIAASDLIPEIHNEEKKEKALVETICLIVGVVVIWFTISQLEQFISH